MTALRERRWFPLVWAIPAALVVLVIVVLVARALRDLPAVQDFITQFPGTTDVPDGTPIGLPAWLRWQHFLNVFFLVLIVRTGWQIRTETRAPAHWTRRNAAPFRTKGAPKRISLTLWFHLTLDALWILNGVIFIVLLFVSGHWARIVPTSWDVVPHALSVALQYASLEWPHENGWVAYNALQLLAYFTIVFIAAPLAFLTGLRMSPAWSGSLAKLTPAFPIGVARAVHYPVMIFFVLFTVVHVVLVLSTGALRNLNHMYAGRDDESWWGFAIFAASLVVIVAAWVLARPVFLRPIASLGGTVSR